MSPFLSIAQHCVALFIYTPYLFSSKKRQRSSHLLKNFSSMFSMPFFLSINVLSSMHLMISPSGQWWFADVAGRCGWCYPADAFRYWVWLIYTTDSVIEKSSISLCYVFMRNGMSPLAVLCVFPEAKVTPVLNRSITKQDTKGCKISTDSNRFRPCFCTLLHNQY